VLGKKINKSAAIFYGCDFSFFFSFVVVVVVVFQVCNDGK
jgi:hypothetical protein